MHTSKNWSRTIATASAVIGLLLTGCSDDDKNPSSQVDQAALVEACAAAQGSISDPDGGTWECADVPVPDDAVYAELDAAFTAFCPPSLRITSGRTSADPPMAGWWCRAIEPGSAASVGDACADAAGNFAELNDGEWTCRDASVTDADTFDLAERALVPYCEPPLRLTSAVLSENPHTVGWSCSAVGTLTTGATDSTTAATASAEAACATVGGSFSAVSGGWTCGAVTVGALDGQAAVQAALSPFCVAPDHLTSVLENDAAPYVASWSCTVPS
ncbi:MAG: hypothetical protein Q7V57_11905 [Actinomycetota bacterium]|nr:hypothetical protein [Actinomycetota bacterium]